MVVNLLHKGKIGLAPMEGVIDALTRDLLTRQAGFDWTVTEWPARGGGEREGYVACVLVVLPGCLARAAR